ncbi:class I SAM-dependent methyltransferase [Vibrio furnissii]|uniref:class I SAM-dependent methyltransferase n=1 Tax=Vibrio furnissii TaxID=29494 RepID=UPI001EEC5A81|nr:class I SAM-dependent methyltransferase [Vibrio furnissii]MCG6268687.1 class I SAM-dependent methyltransferase [Vibrio furnissii]
MSQNIYDNAAFFDGYAQLPRSQFGLDGAPEWASIEAMLPDLTGKSVVDLGCGYGWFCRAATDKGAAKVLGIDLSQKMLDKAHAMTSDARITYQRGDLEHLALGDAQFDLVYSSLALHYLPDLNPIFATVFQALKPGGQLVFSIESQRPIFDLRGGSGDGSPMPMANVRGRGVGVRVGGRACQTGWLGA